jgi:hypothetical protein
VPPLALYLTRTPASPVTLRAGIDSASRASTSWMDTDVRKLFGAVLLTCSEADPGLTW